MELDVSFSYGSSDEEDATASTRERHSQLPPRSGPVAITKGLTNKENGSSIKKMTKTPSRMAKITVAMSRSGSDMTGRSKFLPLSQKEKIKRAAKMKAKQEPPVSPHLSLADLVRHSDVDGKNLFRDSWRQRSNRSLNKSDENAQEQKQERDQTETFEDERQMHGSNILECLLSAIATGGGCGHRDKEPETENLNLSSNNEETSLTSTDVSGGQGSSTKSLLSLSSIPERVTTPPEGAESPVASDKYSVSEVSPQLSPQYPYSEKMNTCIDAIEREDWTLLLKLVNGNPKLLSMTSPRKRNKNLLHILSAKRSHVPPIVLITMINLFPEAVSQIDKDGCIPLHHLSFVGGKEKLVRILLESWSEGTTVCNIDGDTPLHVSVWAGTGNEEVAKLLINAHPKAVSVVNHAGGTPLHLACCEATASPEIVKKIITTQFEYDIDFDSYDNNGNTPLHIALKTRAPLSVIKMIHSEIGPEPFSVADSKKVYPLQMAMSIKDIDPEIVLFICSAAPGIMKKTVTNGMMPVCMAAEQNMPEKVIKTLLLADPPVKFMPLLPNLRDVVLRTHSQSWWLLAISNSSVKYTSVINEILFEMASIHEIVSLCQEPDINGYSSLLDRANYTVRSTLMKNLDFCERYKVSPEYRATVVKGLLLLCAVDTREEGDFDKRNVRSAGYVPSSLSTSQYREVLLHCAVQGSDEYTELLKEISAREKYNFSPLHSQQLYNIHNLSAKKIGCSGEMLCVAFERPILTLQEIFETSRFRKRKNQQWARKSLNLLLSLARVLRYLHDSGYIHGSVEPSTIGKFQGSNNWKMMDMRRATQIGEPMRGQLRYGAPPESISISQSMSDIPNVVKLVSFDENFVRPDSPPSENDSENESIEFPIFSPTQCYASTTWDIWSFGLIMGQLVLGQSMVLLPNFEKATDAHLKNLHQYDVAAVRKISDAARRVSGDEAADLLSDLLQPLPEDRPQSMDEVLNHQYFTKHYS